MQRLHLGQKNVDQPERTAKERQDAEGDVYKRQILTSLKMMEVMLAKKMPMSKLAEPLKIYPQVLENVRVTDKKAAQNDPCLLYTSRCV